MKFEAVKSVEKVFMTFWDIQAIVLSCSWTAGQWEVL
jgi:hypothetical protein